MSCPSPSSSSSSRFFRSPGARRSRRLPLALAAGALAMASTNGVPTSQIGKPWRWTTPVSSEPVATRIS